MERGTGYVHGAWDKRDDDFPIARAGIETPPDYSGYKYHSSRWWGNQLKTSRCVSFATTKKLKDGPDTQPFLKPDEAWLWFLYREAQKRDPWGERSADDGTTVSACFKALYDMGIMGAYYTAQSVHEVITAVRVAPVVIGILWPDSWFEPPADSIVRLKRDSSGKVLERFSGGGHATELNGLNEHKGFFRMPNSWGRDWADRGQAYLPFEEVDWHITQAGGRFVYGTEINTKKLAAVMAEVKK